MEIIYLILISLPIIIFEGAGKRAYLLLVEFSQNNDEFKIFILDKQIAFQRFGKAITLKWLPRHIAWGPLLLHLNGTVKKDEFKSFHGKIKWLHRVRIISISVFLVEVLIYGFMKMGLFER